MAQDGEKENNDRLKQQPEIKVNADAEQVSAVIIKKMIADKYDLEKEDKHQLVFRKKINSGAAGFMIGVLAGKETDNPQEIITYILVKEGDGTLVSARAAILYPNKNNQPIPRNVDNKKVRKVLWRNLDEIKTLMEKK